MINGLLVNRSVLSSCFHKLRLLWIVKQTSKAYNMDVYLLRGNFGAKKKRTWCAQVLTVLAVFCTFLYVLCSEVWICEVAFEEDSQIPQMCAYVHDFSECNQLRPPSGNCRKEKMRPMTAELALEKSCFYVFVSIPVIQWQMSVHQWLHFKQEVLMINSALLSKVSVTNM